MAGWTSGIRTRDRAANLASHDSIWWVKRTNPSPMVIEAGLAMSGESAGTWRSSRRGVVTVESPGSACDGLAGNPRVSPSRSDKAVLPESVAFVRLLVYHNNRFHLVRQHRSLSLYLKQ